MKSVCVCEREKLPTYNTLPRHHPTGCFITSELFQRACKSLREREWENGRKREREKRKSVCVCVCVCMREREQLPTHDTAQRYISYQSILKRFNP